MPRRSLSFDVRKQGGEKQTVVSRDVIIVFGLSLRDWDSITSTLETSTTFAV